MDGALANPCKGCAGGWSVNGDDVVKDDRAGLPRDDLLCVCPNVVELSGEAGAGVVLSPRLDLETGAGLELEGAGDICGVDGTDSVWTCDCAGGGIGGLVIAGGWRK